MPGKYPRPVVCYFFIIKYCLAFAKLQNFSVMTRFSGENRRPSTVLRDNSVHEAYRQLQKETGEYFRFLPRESSSMNAYDSAQASAQRQSPSS